MPVAVSRSGPLLGFQHCSMNQLRWRKTDLMRSRIQTATQRETPSVLRLSRDVSTIDSDCRRSAKPKFAGHPFVADEYLVDLRLDTLCGQDVFNQLHRRRMCRAVCHIQNLNFHSALSGLRAFFSRKIGQ